ncbi:MAG: dehydrogenase (ubiquinone) flavoprotein 2 [Chloroflexota bacterium]|jgi:NADH:ubiquinone oxidoreductase subunit E|nr:dehydrogenase (ubiquinone) flavoprotein 2 [Chloroflexota bacterium]
MSPLQLPGAGAPYRVLRDDEVARIQELRGAYPRAKSAILPALWILQHREGILTAEGMREVGRALELPPGPVEAVASFYSMYFFKPHGRYLVEVCTNISCLLRGSGKVLRRFGDQLDVDPGQTSEDGLATLLEVECLGACGGAPAAQVNHRFFESLTDARVDEMVAAMRAGTLTALVAPGAVPPGAERQVPLHEFASGAEAAAREDLVDLANPGANRMPAEAGGAAGSVVDLVKGHGNLVAGREHPAERGYTEPAPVPAGATDGSEEAP